MELLVVAKTNVQQQIESIEHIELADIFTALADSAIVE
jgi:hypothetical protein